ncbi:MAG: tagaturonate reductase [Lachnospiraceae bacterium]|nr:tagaturonate reductase [Lachnospiraceae bacterium]
MKETIIQFGTGNFLRGFVDYFVDVLNEKNLYNGKIVVVKPTNRGNLNSFTEQDCVYNLYLRGIENGSEVCEKREIHSINRVVDPYHNYESYLELAHNPDIRFIISNTTEAGIEFDDSCSFMDAPALSFPGKLTQLMYERFKAGLSGFVLLPCELIDNNGASLKECVLKYAGLWKLGEEFEAWVENENKFCNTLVDRIVTGYPAAEAEELVKEIGYDDKLLDTAELFHLWVIEGDFENELPLVKAGFNVIWTDDVKPYKKMKVSVLNGAHTSMVFPALLSGIETVRDCLLDEQINTFLYTNLNKYILPVLGETDETKSFADSVIERFKNPYIHHMLTSIALNSVSKFGVRVLPTLLEYKATYGETPKTLALSLAALITYYKKNDISDSEYAVDFIKNNDISEILKNETLWGCDLTDISEVTTEAFDKINKCGIREAIAWSLS